MASQRALAAATATPEIARAHFAAEADPYDPGTNPEGIINLGTAENRLVWDLLEARLTSPRAIRAPHTRYGHLFGTLAFRDLVARFLSRTRKADFLAEDLIVVSGATSALDIIACALCDPGERIVVPAPYYGAFDTDLTGRSQAKLIPAELSSADGFELRADAIEKAVSSARAVGQTVRAVALSSPNNPVGHVYTSDRLRELLDVAASLDLDVVTDEIYANSVFGTQRFAGLFGLDGSTLPPERIHTVWGFAKDFGVPGFKAGVLHTIDPDVRAAARELAYFAPLSTDTQFVLGSLLEDEAWADDFMEHNRARLRHSYRHVTGLLDGRGVTYVAAQSGFSVWMDLRRWLGDASFAAEARLHARLLDQARVNVLPGAAFASPEPGWFRLCHATDAAHVAEAIRRLMIVMGQ